MAWRITGLKSRTRNIEEMPLRVALNRRYVHWDPPCSHFCKQNSKLLRTHRVLFRKSGVLKTSVFRPAFRCSGGRSMVFQGRRDRAECYLYIRMLKWGIYVTV